MNIMTNPNEVASSHLRCGQCREDRDFQQFGFYAHFCSSAPPHFV